MILLNIIFAFAAEEPGSIIHISVIHVYRVSLVTSVANWKFNQKNKPSLLFLYWLICKQGYISQISSTDCANLEIFRVLGLQFPEILDF